MNLAAIRLSLVLTLLCFATPQLAAEDGGAMWIRYPAISPDGQSIAFSYRGDLWVVARDGGEARPITTHAGYERSPVWSPDSQSIAFMADWYGNGDVFVVSALGGQPRRLTFHSAGDEPTSFTPDGQKILFTSRRLDASQAAVGSQAMGELYEVSLQGGRPRQVMTTSGENAMFDRAGKRIVYQDYKGYEDDWRKHHTSSVTRDIWMFEPTGGVYQKLSHFAGEDRNPVWSPDGQSVFYLSEQLQACSPENDGRPARASSDGEKPRVIPQLNSSFNVWRVDLADPTQQTQVTSHKTHPVRFLSIAGDGTLCYTYNSQIWLKSPDADPQALEVRCQAGPRDNGISLERLRDGATEFAVSPNEEEIALVIRGEVFVAHVEFGTTRRITDSPDQERSVTWGSDSRTLYYAGERDQSWNLYQARITRDEEQGFAHATIVTEEPLLVSDDETFQPVCSPDGKKLVYLKNRTEVMLLDLETKQSSTLLGPKHNFSYTDGDIEYDWSPDSRWLLVTFYGHESWISEIGAIRISDGTITNLTESGYSESRPVFASNGTAVLYSSDRYGERSHGSWGGENDVLALYVNQAAYDEATLDKEELALAKKRKEKDKDEDSPSDPEKSPEEKDKPASTDGKQSDDGSDDKKKDEQKPIEPIEFDLSDLDLRLRRMTLHSSALGSFDLSPDGEHLIYTARVDDKWGVWLTEVRERSTQNIFPIRGDDNGGGGGGGGGGGAAVQFTKDGQAAFLVQSDGRVSKLKLGAALSGDGKATAEPVAYAAEMVVDGPAERAYIFEHAWRQVKRKFYDPDLHGVDWDAMKANYQAFLPSINNNYDFAELLSEILGELNASHTGGRYRPRGNDGDATAALGLLYDVAYDGVGLKVAEIIRRGPCDNAESKIEAGTVITHINGQRLTAEVNPWALLNRQADRPVRLTLNHPETQAEWEEVVRPISLGAESNLLYERWIAERRRQCEEWSGGKVGYVHVRGMNDDSFRRVYSEVLGLNNDKQALIVDTRFNGGGWLHEDLATFLSGKRYCTFALCGFENGGLGGEPINKWTKPVAVLQSESNYSDAHFFPWAFKQKGVGKLVGSPVPGTATAVWWESQIDPTLVFGIPQVGMLTLDGEYLENNQLEPDILVVNDPPALAAGDDPQLRAAIEELLKEQEK